MEEKAQLEALQSIKYHAMCQVLGGAPQPYATRLDPKRERFEAIVFRIKPGAIASGNPGYEDEPFTGWFSHYLRISRLDKILQ